MTETSKLPPTDGPHTRPISIGRRYSVASAIIGTSISGVTLLVVCYLVDWSKFLQIFTRLQYTWIVPFIILNVLGIALLAVRWQLLLVNEQQLSALQAFRFIAIGLAANALLPGRPGDLTRAFMLKHAGITSFSNAIASIVLERICDIIVLCVLGLALLIVIPLPSDIAFGLIIVALVTIAVVIVLATMRKIETTLNSLSAQRATSAFFKVASTLSAKLSHFLQALTILRNPRRCIQVLILTVIAWFLLTVAVIALMHAFELPVPAMGAALVIVLTTLGAAIPSSPGSAGVYHSLALVALSVWISDRTLALAFATALHFLSILLHIVLGIFAASMEGVRIMQIDQRAPSALPSSPSNEHTVSNCSLPRLACSDVPE